MLEGIIAKVIISLLSIIGGWLTRHVQEIIKDRKRAADDEAKNEANREALEKAKSKEEREEAAKNVAKDF